MADAQSSTYDDLRMVLGGYFKTSCGCVAIETPPQVTGLDYDLDGEF
jgi:hypothetical protein